MSTKTIRCSSGETMNAEIRQRAGGVGGAKRVMIELPGIPLLRVIAELENAAGCCGNPRQNAARHS
jgi:hypothetical protein